MEFSRITAGGNNETLKNYKDIDPRPFRGVSYYRLEQVDFDGDSDYFGPISIETKGELDFAVIPNPTKHTIAIYFSDLGNLENKSLELFNSIGAQIATISQKVTKEVNTYYYDMSMYPPGIYYVYSGNQVSKFIKQ
jgi:hypothetical protein